MQPEPQNFLDNLSALIANNLPEFLLRLLSIFILLLVGRWLAPVSYTHLDVYKRQAQCWS